jgi:signal peptidase II
MKRPPLWALVTAAAVILLDQATKYAAASAISPVEPMELLPFLNLVNVRNTGAAFGLFAGLGNLFFIAVSFAAVAFIGYLALAGTEGRFALSLIFGGAVGNLIDRLALGYVRDFVDVHVGTYHWPAFNVADSALTVGIILLLLGSIPRGKKISRA